MEPTTKGVNPNTVVLELLSKYNYDDWVEMAQSYFISQDLWDSVDPHIPLGAAKELDADHDPVAETLMDVKGKSLRALDDGKWKKDKKNAAALHAIKISCGPDALSAIRRIVSARQAWITLARKFGADFILELPGFTLDLFSFQGEFDPNIENYVSFKAIERREWHIAMRVYEGYPNLLKATYKSSSYTALHYAVASKKNEKIVEDMVKCMSKEDLERKESSCRWTALAKAIESETASMVKCMIDKNANFLCIADNVGTIPVVLALHYQRMDLFHTLYYDTPMNVLLSEGGKHGATVISRCIKLKNSETIAIALHLLLYAPRLTFAKDNTGKSPVYTLARETVLRRRHWIYDFVSTESAIKDDDFEFDNLFMLGSRFAAPPVESDTSNINSGVYKRTEEQKLVHERSIKLLENMCKTIGFIKEESTLKDGLVFEALFETVDEGNIKFVEELMKANPVFAASRTD